MFDDILKYLYTDRINISDKTGTELLNFMIVADELMLESLTKLVENSFIYNYRQFLQNDPVEILQIVHYRESDGETLLIKNGEIESWMNVRPRMKSNRGCLWKHCSRTLSLFRTGGFCGIFKLNDHGIVCSPKSAGSNPSETYNKGQPSEYALEARKYARGVTKKEEKFRKNNKNKTREKLKTERKIGRSSK
ncbi:hypothetical protein RhiirC2_867012 [Rhizophagus irregularis]|uniref:BTB domain-containing protein n=1 Tax=Rhizophagus irregularis TaxID=588596 RepID=A0A2N1N4W2_9GLOM|nr:hypothetical protein RhiirC2_867012 [Rhizophagus irregularis]